MPATRTSTGTASVSDLLSTAESLLAEGPSGGPLTLAGRVRGATYALRIALEAAVDAILTTEEAAFREVRSTRAKLLCLRHYAGPDLARRTSALWSRLSTGCKYHHDEIGPSHTQVRAWQTAVEALVAELTAPRNVLELPQQAGARRPPLGKSPTSSERSHTIGNRTAITGN
ncbi:MULTISPECIES: hypothetical protein [unclassified Streptomyces]|uniref:hypothetical protein n=1 Tax=unclassified Streptomyces TaxID=2593676 RepID=UPI003406A42A